MIKVEATIKNETKGIAIIVLILSALLEAVYLIIGEWNYTVLLGNLLGAAAGILNFFLMGLGLQSALKKDVKDAKTTAKFSHTYRYLMLAAVMIGSIFIPFLDAVATIVSVFFSSIAVYIRVFVMKKKGDTPVTSSAPAVNTETDDEDVDVNVAITTSSEATEITEEEGNE